MGGGRGTLIGKVERESRPRRSGSAPTRLDPRRRSRTPGVPLFLFCLGGWGRVGATPCVGAAPPLRNAPPRTGDPRAERGARGSLRTFTAGRRDTEAPPAAEVRTALQTPLASTHNRPLGRFGGVGRQWSRGGGFWDGLASGPPTPTPHPASESPTGYPREESRG